MSRTKLLSVLIATACGLAVCLPVLADPPQATKKTGKPVAAAAEPQLPPGWTKEDFARFIAAATPGKMHEHLKQDVGVWSGKNTMWPAPGADPIVTDATTTVTALYDGRFFRADIKGEMPGLGPYDGLMISGYDNVAKKFVATWIDNVSTTIAQGEGELSKDGKTLTWTFTCSCPLQEKPMTMRQVEKVTGPGKKTLEMFGPEPKSGKEYKMMQIEMTKVK
jgi:hypothetical protein